MARITVEDCLEKEQNRFALVKLAALRAKDLLSGKNAVSDNKGNKAIVSALREIADGKVKFTEHVDELPEFTSSYAPSQLSENTH